MTWWAGSFFPGAGKGYIHIEGLQLFRLVAQYGLHCGVWVEDGGEREVKSGDGYFVRSGLVLTQIGIFFSVVSFVLFRVASCFRCLTKNCLSFSVVL